MRQTRMKNGLREEAKLAMWIYYRDHKPSMPVWIREYREEIIAEIQSGKNVENVFNKIIGRVQTELAELDAA